MAKNPSSDFGSFSDLATVKGNTVEKPKNLPDAFYSVRIADVMSEHKAKSGNFAFRFPVQIIECLDSDQAAEIAQDPQMQKALERKYNVDFWMSPDARWRFTEFATKMGCNMENNLIEIAEELVGMGEPFLMQGKNEPSQNDPENIFFRLDNPAPLDTYTGD